MRNVSGFELQFGATPKHLFRKYHSKLVRRYFMTSLQNWSCTRAVTFGRIDPLVSSKQVKSIPILYYQPHASQLFSLMFHSYVNRQLRQIYSRSQFLPVYFLECPICRIIHMSIRKIRMPHSKFCIILHHCVLNYRSSTILFFCRFSRNSNHISSIL